MYTMRRYADLWRELNEILKEIKKNHFLKVFLFNIFLKCWDFNFSRNEFSVWEVHKKNIFDYSFNIQFRRGNK